MRYEPPNLGVLVAVFLALGPFLWPAAMVLVGTVLGELHFGEIEPLGALIGSALAALLGAIAWWFSAFAPRFWLATLIPTTLGALVYWLAVVYLFERVNYAPRSRPRWLALSSLICATTSALVFLVCGGLGILLDLTARPLPTQSVSAASMTFGKWVLVVAVVGLVLGLLAGAIAREAPNPSIERTA